MKKFKCIISLLMLLFITASLFSCGDESGTGNVVGDNNGYTSDIADSSGNPGTDSSEYARKIIRTATMSGQTKAFENAVNGLMALVKANEGITESSSQTGTAEKNNRRSTYVFRIPSANFDAFISGIGGDISIVSSTVKADDITSGYYDILSRIEALKAEKESLQEMLKNANSTSEIMTIHDRIYNVIEETERYQTQINLYDSKVAYSTVNFTLSEVEIFTETGYGSKVSNAFTKGWSTFVSFWKGLFVIIVYILPLIVTASVIAVIIIIAGYRHKRNLKRKNEETMKFRNEEPKNRGDR